MPAPNEITPSQLLRLIGTPDAPALVDLSIDPDFDAEVRPLEGIGSPTPRRRARWDGEDVLDADGTYGAYVVRKVSRVFPALGRDAFEG